MGIPLGSLPESGSSRTPPASHPPDAPISRHPCDVGKVKRWNPFILPHLGCVKWGHGQCILCWPPQDGLHPIPECQAPSHLTGVLTCGIHTLPVSRAPQGRRESGPLPSAAPACTLPCWPCAPLPGPWPPSQALQLMAGEPGTAPHLSVQPPSPSFCHWPSVPPTSSPGPLLPGEEVLPPRSPGRLRKHRGLTKERPRGVTFTSEKSGANCAKLTRTTCPWWLRWQRISLQCRRPGFLPWIETIPW